MSTILRGKPMQRESNFYPAENTRQIRRPWSGNATVSKEEQDSIMRQMEMLRHGKTTFRRIQLNTWTPFRGRTLKIGRASCRERV